MFANEPNLPDFGNWKIIHLRASFASPFRGWPRSWWVMACRLWVLYAILAMLRSQAVGRMTTMVKPWVWAGCISPLPLLGPQSLDSLHNCESIASTCATDHSFAFDKCLCASRNTHMVSYRDKGEVLWLALSALRLSTVKRIIALRKFHSSSNVNALLRRKCLLHSSMLFGINDFVSIASNYIVHKIFYRRWLLLNYV